MVEGRYPFDFEGNGGRNIAAMLKAQVRGKFAPMQKKYSGSLLEDLIARLLHPDPGMRLSVAQAQRHSWVVGAGNASSLDIARAIQQLRLDKNQEESDAEYPSGPQAGGPPIS